MRGNRFTESLDPNEKNITFSLIAVFALWYDVFFPQVTYMGRLFQAESSPLTIDSPLYTLLFGWLQSWNFALGVIALLMLIGVGGLAIRFNGNFAYIKVRTILPAVFFCVIGSILFSHTFTLGTVLMVLLMGLLYANFYLAETFNPICAFNGGMLIATMTLLSPWCVLLCIPTLIFYYSTSVLNARTFLGALFGFIVPLLYATLYFVVTNDIETLTNYFIEGFKFFVFKYDLDDIEMCYLAFLGGTTAWAIGNFLVDNTHDNIKSRKQNTHIINLFLWMLALMIIAVPDAKNLLHPLTLLWGLLLGRFFSLNSSKLSYILFFAFFGVSLLTYVLPHFL